MKTSLSQISVQTALEGPEKWMGEVLVLPLFKDAAFPSPTREIDQALSGALRKRVERDRFEGEPEKTHWVEIPALKAGRILLTSLGKKKDYSRAVLREAYGAAARALLDRQVENVTLAFVEEKKIAQDFDAAIEGFLLGAYRFDRYRSELSGKRKIKNVTVIGGDPGSLARIEKELSRILVYGHATYLTRDLTNEPANVANPTLLAKMAGALAQDQRLRIEIFDEKKLKDLGMNLILAVGMGSSERPRMVHLEYKPQGKVAQRAALIGKGVTFDSGGLSLKPQANLYGMKSDMSGAAAVLAATWAASVLKLPVHLHTLVPLVENLPSDRSVKPGDVFIAANGKSVEIENTDAEGRLVLADAICYAKKLGVDYMVDVATLTGACMVALGEDIAGAIGNDPRLIDRIDRASKRAGEKFWQLPLEKSYLRLLKSDVADLKNVGGKFAGAITGALFLSEFAGDRPWVHLDIAGPAFIDRDWPICPKGATGFGVRTFLELFSGRD